MWDAERMAQGFSSSGRARNVPSLEGRAQGVPWCIPAPSPASRHSWTESPAVGRQICRNKEAIATGMESKARRLPRKRRGREIRFVPLPLGGRAGEGSGEGSAAAGTGARWGGQQGQVAAGWEEGPQTRRRGHKILFVRMLLK